MAQTSSTPPVTLDELLKLRPVGLDDFSDIRSLHATAVRAHTQGALSEEEAASVLKLVASPDYPALLLREELYGGWIDGELVGTVSWHAGGSTGATATISGIFVRHVRLGIGSRLLAEAEMRAHRSGFDLLSAGTTANAVPFFLRFGYEKVSLGVRTLAPDCRLPVTFLRKRLPPGRPPHAPLN